MTKRGRPQFKPTAKMRRTVEEMVSCGEPKTRIARAIGIDSETLDKHFGDELAHGLSRRRREVLELLFKSARSGNVTAQKQLAAMTGLAAADAEVRRIGDAQRDEARAAAAPKVGKKEAAQAAAESAGLGTEWGDDLQVGATSRPN